MSSPFIRTPAEQILHDVHNNAESAHAAGGIPEGYDLQGNQLNGTNPNEHAPYGTELGHDISLPENYQSPSTRNAGVVALIGAGVRRVVGVVPGLKHVRKDQVGWQAREKVENAKVAKKAGDADKTPWYEAPANVLRVFGDMTGLKPGKDEHGNDLPERSTARKVVAMIGGVALAPFAAMAAPFMAVTYPARVAGNLKNKSKEIFTDGIDKEIKAADLEKEAGDSLKERAIKFVGRAVVRVVVGAENAWENKGMFVEPVKPKVPVRRR